MSILGPFQEHTNHFFATRKITKLVHSAGFAGMFYQKLVKSTFGDVRGCQQLWYKEFLIATCIKEAVNKVIIQAKIKQDIK